MHRIRMELCKSLTVIISFIALSYLSTALSADPPIDEYSIITPPSWSQKKETKETVVDRFSCYGVYDGTRYPCHVESEMLGHKQVADLNRWIPNRPMLNCDAVTNSNTTEEERYRYGWDTDDVGQVVSPMFNNTLYRLKDVMSDAEKVEGEPENGQIELNFDTTIDAGIVQTATILTVPEHPMPNSYVWVFATTGFNQALFRGYHLVVVEGLSRLPGCTTNTQVPGQNYRLARLDLSRYPEAHWGTSNLLQVVFDFSELIHDDLGIIMSYNDASLPMGGQIGPSTTEHETHRAGNDIDINKNALGYTCPGDPNFSVEDLEFYWMHSAFYSLYGPRSIDEIGGNEMENAAFPNLDCHGNGNMHIDAAPGV